MHAFTTLHVHLLPKDPLPRVSAVPLTVIVVRGTIIIRVVVTPILIRVMIGRASVAICATGRIIGVACMYRSYRAISHLLLPPPLVPSFPPFHTLRVRAVTLRHPF